MKKEEIELKIKDFIPQEKDVWGIITQYINTEIVSGEYVDSLVDLVKETIIKVAPFYAECYNMEELIKSTDLNPIRMHGENTPLTNTIEASVIEDNLWKYLEKNTRLGKYLQEHPEADNERENCHPKSSPELRGVAEIIGYNYLDPHRPSHSSVNEEHADYMKHLFDTEFSRITVWNREEEEKIYYKFMRIRPAEKHPDLWKWTAFSFIEWYCMKNSLQFYPLYDFYYLNYQKEMDFGDYKESPISELSLTMYLHMQRYGIENAEDTLQLYPGVMKILNIVQNWRREWGGSELYHTAAELTGIIAEKYREVNENLVMDRWSYGELERMLDAVYRKCAGRYQRCNMKTFRELAMQLFSLINQDTEQLDDIIGDCRGSWWSFSLKDEDDEPDEKKDDEKEMDIEEVISYYKLYEIIGLDKALEAKDDVCAVLQEYLKIYFDEETGNIYENSEERFKLYNSLKEAFSKHLSREHTEVVSQILFKHLMNNFWCCGYDADKQVIDESVYLEAIHLISGTESPYYRRFTKDGGVCRKVLKSLLIYESPVEINRIAERISWRVNLVREHFAGNWTPTAHDTLFQTIDSILSDEWDKKGVVRNCHTSLSYRELCQNQLYLALCREYGIAPMSESNALHFW